MKMLRVRYSSPAAFEIVKSEIVGSESTTSSTPCREEEEEEDNRNITPTEDKVISMQCLKLSARFQKLHQDSKCAKDGNARNLPFSQIHL